MSLSNLTSLVTATIKRNVSTKGSAGGQLRNYTTAGRGSLPTTSTGRLEQSSGDRRFAYEMHDTEVDAQWYTTTDPQCDNSDILVIGTDTYFVQAERNFDITNTLYRVDLKKYSRQLQ